MDLYSQKLAQHLSVPLLETDIYQRSAELFNVSLFSRPALRSIGQDWRFIRQLRALPEPLHFPNHHLGRYALFARSPHVITVHDLIRYFDMKASEPFIHRPNLRDRLYLSLDYAGIRRAPAIIAISEKTKQDLIENLNIPEERIHVIYHGVDHASFRPVVERPYEGRYVLFVGSEHPRKNLITLLKAFRRLKQDARFSDLKLLKVGAAGGQEAPFREMTLRAIADLGLTNDVVFTGYVADAALPGYYSGAQCLVLPSLAEGFGFPPLEAMACGCPVLVSDAGSLPEIVGNGGVVLPARDDAAMAAKLAEVITDAAYRNGLRAAGLKRASQFTWESTAEQTARVYEVVAGMWRGRPTRVAQGTAPELSEEMANLDG